MTAARTVPALAPSRPLRLPQVSDTVLPNGLRVLAVRRPGVPLVEVRLRVPSPTPSGRAAAAHRARTQLLADTLLLGTERRDAAQLATDLQALGGELGTGADADRVSIGGSVLAPGLPALLELLAEVLTSASYPRVEVAGERDRLISELAIHRAQAGVLAREALLAALHGDHPYGRDLPTSEEVGAVTPAQLRALHAARLAPAGSALVLVGDLTPARLTAAAEKALSGWASTRPAPAPVAAPPVPDGPAVGSVRLVHRPGAVQSTLRWSRAVPDRSSPDYPALVLANLVFGGYFSSRWVANIREDKGWTYSPHSTIEHLPAVSRLVVAADVTTEFTAASVLETFAELGRVATLRVPDAELDQARRYASGSLSLGTSSQAGLASTLVALAGAGLGLPWLRDHLAALQRVTPEQVLEAGRAHLAPTGLTGVVVGDADVVTGPLGAVVPVLPAG